jgi:hypothetical protein
MLGHNNTEAGKVVNFPISGMLRTLEQLNERLSDRSIDLCDTELCAVMDRHWSIRESINSTAANNQSEIVAKARALQLESQRDPDFGNEGPGSACELAKSLAEDVIRLLDASK